MSSGIRFSGMASGMDTESIVKQLMQAKRFTLNKFTQDKTRTEWKREAYHSVNKDIATFLLNARKKLGLTDYTYMGKLSPNSINKVDWAKKAKSSDENAIAVSADSTANTGSIDITVENIAKKATISGTTKLTSTSQFDNTDFKKIVVNGKEVDLSTVMSYEEASKKIAKETGLDITFGKVGQTKDSSGAVTETYMFSLSTKETGADQKITFDESAKKLFEKLGVSTFNGDATNGYSVSGENAKYTINGATIENSTNNVDINGLKLTLKNTTKSAVNVSVSTDVDGIYNKIKEFVDDYNKVVGGLQDKIAEKSYRDYAPLLSEQKEAMKENDIKLWEEKAKSGLLAKDSNISSMLSNVRSGMYEKVSGAGSMYEFGIETGNWKDGAKLNIDEKKLKKALSEDPQKVLDTLFKASDDITDYTIKKGDTAEQIAAKRAGAKAQREGTGVFVRIMDDMADGMKSIVTQAGTGKESSLLKDVRGNIMSGIVSGKSLLEENIKIFDTRIVEENRRLKTYEDNLWRQFTAMEKAIQQMRDQSGWLMQQVGGQ
ncbi:flagellar filament capping protein FliD [Criibacterium bergeronii]|uniref:Flagellar hook-associated protein 2 n=1 Tax=Criibacterium bergeronii TaxID=1871336 RepID=A0A371IN49_9FIRM|nr:flagellar filament capping protein FliD [Criibacterium bergeronii]RDY21901.1 flagellar hook protein [Criibacterium bergeronii]